MVRIAHASALIILASAWPAAADAERFGRAEQVMVQIAGTTWVADDGPLGKVTYYFDPSGALVYTYSNGQEYRNGTWKLQGRALYFEANRQYREFRGPITERRIAGSSWNKAGERWSTTLVPAPKVK